MDDRRVPEQPKKQPTHAESSGCRRVKSPIGGKRPEHSPVPPPTPAAESAPNHGPDTPAKKKQGPPRLTYAFPGDWPQVKREGITARDLMVPLCISEIIGSDAVSIVGARTYLGSLYPNTERPTDALGQIMFDQIVVAHQRLLQLQLRAHEAQNVEVVKVLNHAATRLLGEIRRFALSIKQYRQPASAKSFAVIHQQNVATGTAGQQVSYVDQSSAEKTEASFSCRQSELEGNAHDEPFGGRFAGQTEEPAAGVGREDQRVEAPAMG